MGWWEKPWKEREAVLRSWQTRHHDRLCMRPAVHTAVLRHARDCIQFKLHRTLCMAELFRLAWTMCMVLAGTAIRPRFSEHVDARCRRVTRAAPCCCNLLSRGQLASGTIPSIRADKRQRGKGQARNKQAAYGSSVGYCCEPDT